MKESNKTKEVFFQNVREMLPEIKKMINSLKEPKQDKNDTKLLESFCDTVYGAGGAAGFDDLVKPFKGLGDRLRSLREKGKDFDKELLSGMETSLAALEDRITVLELIEKTDLSGDIEKELLESFPEEVLIISSDPGRSREMALNLTGRNIVAVEAGEAAAAVKILEKAPPDMILLHGDGLDVFRSLGENKWIKLIPVVYLNDSPGSYRSSGAAEPGIEEVVTKSFSPQEIGDLVAARLKRAGELRRSLTRDPLTGVFSLRYLMERLTEETERFSRKKRPFSVAVCGLDLFDRLTGENGHQAGRFVLREFAAFLMAKFRRSDTIGWCGAEKFILLLPETDHRTACKVLERLQEAWGNKSLVDPFQNKDIKIAFSAGVSEFDRDGRNERDIINAAAIAFMANKNKTGAISAAKEYDIPQRAALYRILVVDDSVVIRTRLYEELKGKFQVFLAVDGKDALFQMHKVEPHLIIADLVMPNMGGLELIKNIRQNQRYKNVKIIALTGDRQKKTFLEVFRAGVDDYLVKDASYHGLEARILRVLKRK
ncbi:MAG: response regulator [Bacillota bacterium]